jgi:thiosulfate/3-mercaptopyruvate sulfurtransferase
LDCAGTVEGGEALAATAVKFSLTEAKTELKTADQITARLGRSEQNLIDARGAPRFRGEVEPLDPIAGHIPGALNRPFGQNFDPAGRFKPAHQLRQEFEVLLGQRDPASVVHHCGSGVSAVPNIIAMEVAGLGRGALYAGSWSEWCSDPTRPVAQG